MTVPKEFFIRANGTYTFDITVDARNVPVGEVRHAVVTFIEINGCEVRFPITIVRGEPDISMTQQCDPSTLALRGTTDCAISITNNTFTPAEVSLVDNLPSQLKLVSGSVSGGTGSGNKVTFNGVVAGAAAPTINIAQASAPFGYVALSGFGITPIQGISDESAANYNVPAFNYGGETWTRIGIVSNGYAVVGGTSGSADIQFFNTNLPDPARPNNMLAPFWTDLNPAFGGDLRIAALSSGANSWIVLEWDRVVNYSDLRPNSFQIWVPYATNTGPANYTSITFAYGPVTEGDAGYLTVGAENRFGNSGATLYFDGVGTRPVNGSGAIVTSSPGAPGETKVISFRAQGQRAGAWTNYAELTSDSFFGTYIVPFSGQVTQ